MNAVQNNKLTALHFAAQYGYVDVAEVLLQNGARRMPFIKTNGRHFTGQLNMDMLTPPVLLQNSEVNANSYKRTALHIAALNGHADIAKVLRQNGADVNAVEKDKWTHHAAAQEGHIDVVKVLIQNGADVNAVRKTLRQHFT